MAENLSNAYIRLQSSFSPMMPCSYCCHFANRVQRDKMSLGLKAKGKLAREATLFKVFASNVRWRQLCEEEIAPRVDAISKGATCTGK